MSRGSPPPPQEDGAARRERSRRERALQEVYQEFDLDGNGHVGEDEMLILGQTRRKLGQKTGERDSTRVSFSSIPLLEPYVCGVR